VLTAVRYHLGYSVKIPHKLFGEDGGAEAQPARKKIKDTTKSLYKKTPL
tara:strand:+ start:97 stop:243 length:147 start_codon:yes stop_codon:yes gene_type:complete